VSGEVRLVAAEFASGSAALEAAGALRARGFSAIDIYSPFEVAGAAEVLEPDRPRAIQRAVLAAALTGAVLGYWIQWYVTAVSYPYDVGGRPIHPVPAFVPITFESAVLLGSLAALLAVVVTGRLGRLWQPVFEIEGFESASIDRFWVAVHGRDPQYDAEKLRDALGDLHPLRISVVEDGP
jgi:Alternative complex III, ActD subunit